jgi:hypothetical protein
MRPDLIERNEGLQKRSQHLQEVRNAALKEAQKINSIAQAARDAAINNQ